MSDQNYRFSDDNGPVTTDSECSECGRVFKEFMCVAFCKIELGEPQLCIDCDPAARLGEASRLSSMPYLNKSIIAGGADCQTEIEQIRAEMRGWKAAAYLGYLISLVLFFTRLAS